MKNGERQEYLRILRIQLARPVGSFRHAARWLLSEVDRLEREIEKLASRKSRKA